MINKCSDELHVFEYSTVHEFNPSDFQMPYGSEGKHTCLCGERWKEEPKIDTIIREGTMIHDILSHKHLTK